MADDLSSYSFGGYGSGSNWFDGVGGFSFGPDNGSGISGSGGGGFDTGDWLGIINRGFDITSQIIARGGKYPTEQAGWTQQFGSPYGYSGGSNANNNPYAGLTAAQREALLAQQRGLAEGTTSSIGKFISQNPTTTMLLAGGALLLFMKPPGRR